MAPQNVPGCFFNAIWSTARQLVQVQSLTVNFARSSSCICVLQLNEINGTNRASKAQNFISSKTLFNYFILTTPIPSVQFLTVSCYKYLS